MLVGLRLPVCCGTEALLLPSHGIDHYCTTAHFFMSGNTDLGAVISDDTFFRVTERITIYLTRSTSTIVSGPAVFCALEIIKPGDAITP
jgi:hypothetical protein